MKYFYFLILLFGGISNTLFAQIHVWAIDESEKIRRDDIHNVLMESVENSVWKNDTVHLFGAHNETVGFQLIVQADSVSIHDLQVHLDSLTGPLRIANNVQTSERYTLSNKFIEFFAAHYMFIDVASSHPSLWWDKAAPSTYYKGPLPDALIPIEVFQDSGLTVVHGNNQSIWCDITIPQSIPSGIYSGTIKISSDNKITQNIPVILRLFDFMLSDTTHFANFFVLENKGIAYKHGVPFFSTKYYQIEKKYYQMAHRHRMDLAVLQPLDSLISHAAGYFTGEAFTTKAGYDGPGLNIGQMMYPIGVYDQPDRSERSGFIPVTREGWQLVANRWLGWFSQNAPQVQLLRYMIDEPDSTKYATIKERASWLHDVIVNNRRIPTLCTTYKIDPRLFGAVDYWGLTAQSGYDPGDGVTWGYVKNKVLDRKKAGNKIVLYNGTRPSSPCPLVIDVDAVEPRIIPWVSWKYHIDAYFLWGTNLYYNDARRVNPWKENYTIMDNHKQWGNGTFFYPGEEKEHPESNLGIQGPIASVRMKNWRRGQQDYEYFILARNIGLGSVVDSMITSLIPFAFDDVPLGQNSQPTWKLRGYEYEKARRMLGEQIEAVIQEK